MGEENLRAHAERHADAVVRGDLPALAADFADELRPHLGTLAQALPQPVRAAEVLSVDADADPAVVHIKYVGEDRELTIRSEWTGDSRPVITAAAPV